MTAIFEGKTKESVCVMQALFVRFRGLLFKNIQLFYNLLDKNVIIYSCHFAIFQNK
jgi:hypothetical protein